MGDGLPFLSVSKIMTWINLHKPRYSKLKPDHTRSFDKQYKPHSHTDLHRFGFYITLGLDAYRDWTGGIGQVWTSFSVNKETDQLRFTINKYGCFKFYKRNRSNNQVFVPTIYWTHIGILAILSDLPRVYFDSEISAGKTIF